MYRKADQELDKDFIQLAFNEIKRRNLRVDKPRHIKLIK
ncbi:sporulation histidine kinase inhibitor Sda [Halobacillus seohaensis]|uniref:Sporulation histidine kinase inhibitor Sda n=1 Tax=Halobacillus seohaensis TaxID=447421 RepID=A0ABW2EMK3_9BACI